MWSRSRMAASVRPFDVLEENSAEEPRVRGSSNRALGGSNCLANERALCVRIVLEQYRNKVFSYLGIIKSFFPNCTPTAGHAIKLCRGLHVRAQHASSSFTAGVRARHSAEHDPEAEPKVGAGDANRKLPHSSILAASSSTFFFPCNTLACAESINRYLLKPLEICHLSGIGMRLKNIQSSNNSAESYAL
ncbi:hypothetical protein EAG_02680 [Camponotus floridanus]|uniref:Uncharacterized protein n=1 Tax=Camponotus floridanus TaxID=104421 RepID=E2B1H4_CAMFO|nr:hypothetical protein EAG_02680 [Camponotus floridanus]